LKSWFKSSTKKEQKSKL